MKSVLLFCALLLFLHLFFFFLRDGGTLPRPNFFEWFSRESRDDRHTNKINRNQSAVKSTLSFLTRKIFSFHASPKHTQREKKRRKQRERRETARARVTRGNKN